MSALFGQPNIPPPQALPKLPTTATDEVRKASDDRLRASMAEGRAANYLTNPTMGYKDPVNKQQYLGTI